MFSFSKIPGILKICQDTYVYPCPRPACGMKGLLRVEICADSSTAQTSLHGSILLAIRGHK